MRNLTYVGTINGVDIDTLHSNSNVAMSKTLSIEENLSLDGTHFTANVFADKCIINGGGPSPPGYLLSVGTIASNSGSNNNSNIYHITIIQIQAKCKRTNKIQ